MKVREPKRQFIKVGAGYVPLMTSHLAPAGPASPAPGTAPGYHPGFSAMRAMSVKDVGVRKGRRHPMVSATPSDASGGIPSDVLSATNQSAFGGGNGTSGYGLCPTPIWACQTHPYWSPFKSPPRHELRGYGLWGAAVHHPGYGQYINPDVLKGPVNSGAIGVGLAAGAATMVLGLLATGIARSSATKFAGTPSVARTIPAVLLPAAGAGFIAYLLRWHLEKCCPCGEGQTFRPTERTPEGTIMQQTCPPCPGSNYTQDPVTCECHETII